ncbi:MAG: hypothetical protein AAFN00_15870, partial [Cyanobacteria bacterium J06558_2]
MKSHLFTITTLCFISTGFNSHADVQNNFNHGYWEQSENWSNSRVSFRLKALENPSSTNLVQNIDGNPRNAIN